MGKLADLNDAIVACKSENYDAYDATFQAALATRLVNLGKIEDFVDDAIASRPAPGAQGARCEKALSNGTFRPRRDETTCNEGLCCGAAHVPLTDAMTMIIETCEPIETQTVSWQAPRSPMSTTADGAEFTANFTCIEGAQKLAAAASALAAAVYMLA